MGVQNSTGLQHHGLTLRFLIFTNVFNLPTYTLARRVDRSHKSIDKVSVAHQSKLGRHSTDMSVDASVDMSTEGAYCTHDHVLHLSGWSGSDILRVSFAKCQPAGFYTRDFTVSHYHFHFFTVFKHHDSQRIGSDSRYKHGLQTKTSQAFCW